MHFKHTIQHPHNLLNMLKPLLIRQKLQLYLLIIHPVSLINPILRELLNNVQAVPDYFLMTPIKLQIMLKPIQPRFHDPLPPRKLRLRPKQTLQKLHFTYST